MAKKSFVIEITETLQKRVRVSAETREEALEKVREKYRDEEIVLYPEDWVDTSYEVIKEKD